MKRETKISAISVKLLQGLSDKQIREQLKISKSTYFYWKKRIQEEGTIAVVQKKRPGPQPKSQINLLLSKKILNWRDRYGWGPTRIEGHLRVHFSMKVSHRQIYKLLCKTNRNKPIREPRRTWGKKRWERKYSMSILQADWTDIRSEPKLTFIDDHSRFITGSEIFDEATIKNSIYLLEKIIRKFSKPEQILTDQGVQFCNVRGEKLSQFTQFCMDNKIKHIRASKGRPTTIGKVEAYHGCYRAEGWRFSSYSRWVRYWNYERPNGAIGYLYPVEVFYRDMR